MEDKEYYVLWLRLTAYLVTCGKYKYMSGTAISVLALLLTNQTV